MSKAGLVNLVHIILSKAGLVDLVHIILSKAGLVDLVHIILSKAGLVDLWKWRVWVQQKEEALLKVGKRPERKDKRQK